MNYTNVTTEAMFAVITRILHFLDKNHISDSFISCSPLNLKTMHILGGAHVLIHVNWYRFCQSTNNTYAKFKQTVAHNKKFHTKFITPNSPPFIIKQKEVPIHQTPRS